MWMEGDMQYLGNDWHDILKPVSGIEVRISWKVGDMQYMRYIFSMIVYWNVHSMQDIGYIY